ncbi:MAG: FtsX-like permease family protein [Acidimicrobiales bacterium]
MSRSEVSLGVRLALAGGRSSTARLVVTAMGVALGVALLLAAGATGAALQQRDDHTDWREPTLRPLDPSGLDAEIGSPALLWRASLDRFRGNEFARFDVAALGPGAPVPPGLERLPGPGEVAASPELAELIRTTPARELGDRYGSGEVTAIVGDEGLESPDELLVIVGADPAMLGSGPSVDVGDTVGDEIPVGVPVGVVDSFERRGSEAAPSQSGQVLVVIGALALLVPIAVLVATAARLAAAQREQRLATLRLVGASPAQTRRVAAIEGGLVGVVGAIAGWGLFAALQPAIAGLPLNPSEGTRFFADDLWPRPGVVALVLVLTPLVTMTAAVASLRRLDISPLGVSRRAPVGQPSALRIAPLVLALPLFALAMRTASHGEESDGAVALIGSSFVLVIAGIVIAGPLLVWAIAAWLARHARGPAGLVAARRLAADPRAGYRAIGGVVLAVFVASFFAGIRPTLNFGDHKVPTARYRDGSVAILLNSSADAADAADVIDAVAAVPGTGRPVETPLVGVNIGGQFSLAMVASCDDLITVLELTLDGGCASRQMFTPDGRDPGPIQLEVFDPERSQDPTLVPMAAPEGIGRIEPREIGYNELLIDPSLLPPTVPQYVDKVLVPTDGAGRTLDQIRTAAAPWVLGDLVVSELESSRATDREISQVSRALTLAMLATLLVAGCSVAIAAVGGLLERRMPFALLRLSGTPLRTLRAVVMGEAALPLLTLATTSALLGLGVSWITIRFSGGDTRYEWPSIGLVVVLAAGLAATLAVVASILPLLDRVTRTEATRFE